MNKSILTVFIATASLFASAQEAEKPSTDSIQKIQHRLGLHAGTTSEVGFSYKLVLKEKHQIQAVVLPIASKDDKTLFSGLTYRYKYRTIKNWDMLSFVSASYYYNKYSLETYYVYDEPSSSNTLNENLNVSAGLGFEYGRNDFFKINMQIGYALYDITDEDWHTNLSAAVGFDFLLNRPK
tara:strand:+ start:873 stop:1415 length:543 start_codon:yes stop_codon:yes gene_type:complete